jgi:hypothetical protein
VGHLGIKPRLSLRALRPNAVLRWPSESGNGDRSYGRSSAANSRWLGSSRIKTIAYSSHAFLKAVGTPANEPSSAARGRADFPTPHNDTWRSDDATRRLLRQEPSPSIVRKTLDGKAPSKVICAPKVELGRAACVLVEWCTVELFCAIFLNCSVAMQ